MQKGVLGTIVLFILLTISLVWLKNTPTPSNSITPVDMPLSINQGFVIGTFSENMEGVRDLTFSPGGTLVASLTSKGTVMGISSKNGKASSAKTILSGLDNPHGVSFYNDFLYVAEEKRLARYSWNEINGRATHEKELFSLPSGGSHYTRSIVFDSFGNLYLSIGSTCNICREKDPRLASIMISDPDGKNPRVYAKGLRNSVFMTLNAETNEIWATEMGRDFLGDDSPPDEINIIRQEKDYGWPDCYGNKIPDTDINSSTITDKCSGTESPVYHIQAHSAPLGLIFINSPIFPDNWQGDLFVAYHGSWNRSQPVGYKIVRLDVENNNIVGEEDFLTGFRQNTEVTGRPVALAFDKIGNLYVSDDKAGKIYIVSNK